MKDDFVVNMVNRNYWSQTHRKASTMTSNQGHTDNAVIHLVSHVKVHPPPPPFPTRRERREQFIEVDEGYKQFVLPCNTMVRPDRRAANKRLFWTREILIINADRLSFVQMSTACSRTRKHATCKEAKRIQLAIDRVQWQFIQNAILQSRCHKRKGIWNGNYE